MIRVVDVHAHAVIRPAQLRAGREVLSGDLPGPLPDLDTRLAAMDAAGVDVQAVSAVPEQRHPRACGRLVDVANDGIAELVRRAPDRLVGVATAALHHPDLAAEQLRRAVDDYDFRGVQISASAGRDLSGPALDPFWSIAAALGVVVFVHPPDCPPDPPVTTAPAVSHLVSGGVLERFPDLTVCVAHGNGYSILRSPADTVGPDRLLWGSGYPFTTYVSRPRDIVESSSRAESEAIRGGTARAVLRLNGPAPPDDPGTSSPNEEPTIMTDAPVSTLSDELLELLRAPSTCYLTTLMPDGSPQLTQTWVDTDGKHILINTVVGFQKLRNVERDARVAVAVADPARPARYVTVRGRVVSSTTEGAVDQIEALARKYLGGPYPWYGGRDQVRITLTIAVEKVHAMGG